MSKEIVKVNLHCHSTFSDGAHAPEDLARLLAADGIAYASLTDHDSCEGSRRFRDELSRLGIGCIDGVEITAASARGEVHLLAYGIDAGNAALRDALAGERRRNDPGMQGLVDSMKRIRSRSRAGFVKPVMSAPPEVLGSHRYSRSGQRAEWLLRARLGRYRASFDARPIGRLLRMKRIFE